MTADPDAERRRWRRFNDKHGRIARAWAEDGYPHPLAQYPTMPPDLATLTCGARTRAGTAKARPRTRPRSGYSCKEAARGKHDDEPGKRRLCAYSERLRYW